MNYYKKINSIFKREKDSHKFTDEYSCPEFDYLKNNVWEWTEKIDGTNVVIYWNGTEVQIGGHTAESQMPVFLMDTLRKIFIPNMFEDEFGTNGEMYLYGEGFGNKIQKVGKLYLPDSVSFILFDVKIGPWWLKREDVNDIAETLSIKAVPTVGCGTLDEAIQFVKTKPNSLIAENCPMEGLVLRPKILLFDRSGNLIITKVKVKDYRHELR